jgi:hypothetical protein
MAKKPMAITIYSMVIRRRLFIEDIAGGAAFMTLVSLINLVSFQIRGNPFPQYKKGHMPSILKA